MHEPPLLLEGGSLWGIIKSFTGAPGHEEEVCTANAQEISQSRRLKYVSNGSPHFPYFEGSYRPSDQHECRRTKTKTRE